MNKVVAYLRELYCTWLSSPPGTDSQPFFKKIGPASEQVSFLVQRKKFYDNDTLRFLLTILRDREV